MEFLEFESTFTTNDNIIFVIDSSTRVTDGNYPDAIRWITESALALTHVIRVDSLANYPHPSAYDDTVVVESVLDWACPKSKPCLSSINDQLQSLHLTNRLVSADQKAAGIIATVSIERGSVGEIESLHDEIKALASEFKKTFPAFNISFTGGVPMMAAFAEATADDLSLLLPLAFITIFILLLLVLGSATLAGLLLLLGLASTAITLGIAGWSGHVINNATSIVPVVLLTLVVTSCMHIAVHFSGNLAGRSASKETKLIQARASVTSNIAPILISAITSAVSLTSLMLVDSPPLQQLGVLSAGGVLIGCALSLILLPICLPLMPTASKNPLSAAIQRMVNSYAKSIEKTGPPILSASIFLGVICIGLTQLKIDDNFVRFFDSSVDFRQQTDRATDLLTGPNHIELILQSTDEKTVFYPQFIHHLNELSVHLRSNPLIANVHSFSDVMEQVSLAFAGKSVSSATSTEELSQLYLIYELSLQVGQTNTDLVSADHGQARISVLLKESSSAQIQQLEKEIREFHDQSNIGYKLVITGENIPVAHLSRMNITSMLSGIGFTLCFTAVGLGIFFRSAKLGFVALIATIVPVIAGFGAWGWLNDTIGLATTAIIALTIGVVVDDTAHFLYRFLDARSRLDLTPTQAAAYATHRVGTAITSSTVVLGLGLSLLLFSDFEVNSIFGAVTCLIIFMALIFDLTILPKLAIWATTKHDECGSGRQ
jgi:predicted RND superfamily exporter protein